MTEKRIEAVFQGARSRDVISAILAIHFPDDPLIVDLTWGKGAFWSGQLVLGLDLAPRAGCYIKGDARAIPLRSELANVAVFDPPHTWSRGKNPGSAGLVSDFAFLRSKEELLELCRGAAIEMRRVADLGCILKVMDTVKHGAYHPIHIEVAGLLLPILGQLEDLAILNSQVVRPEGPNWGEQKHLRNAHSYFLVYKWGHVA